MHDRGDGRDTRGERDRSNGLDTSHERGDQCRLFDIEHRRWEGHSVVVDLDDAHTIGERRNVQHVEQRRLRLTDSVTCLDEMDVRDDFDCTTGDLCGDIQSLEEGRFTRFHTGVSSRYEHVVGSNRASSSGRSDSVRDDRLSNSSEVTVGKDESDVTLDEWQEFLELREFGKDTSECSSNHRVLAHEHDTGPSERLSDHVQLLGRDIVDVDDED